MADSAGVTSPDQRIADNRSTWEARVPVHMSSAFYDVDGFISDLARGPRPWEAAVIGDVTGLDLTHLQCHIGTDTLAWARAGARVTGLDFSAGAIVAAREIAARAGLDATFIEANVLDSADALGDDSADLVYVSLGAVCWFGDLHRWATQITRILRPGGRFFLHESHPLSGALADDGTAIERSMYGVAPTTWTDASSYTDGGEALPVTTSHDWNHGIGEVISALLASGLALEHIEEHPWTSWRRFPFLVNTGEQRFELPHNRPRVPLSYTLLCGKPTAARDSPARSVHQGRIGHELAAPLHQEEEGLA